MTVAATNIYSRRRGACVRQMTHAEKATPCTCMTQLRNGRRLRADSATPGSRRGSGSDSAVASKK